MTRCVPSPRNDAVTHSPPVPRPLLTRPVPTRASAGCVLCLRLCVLPQKNLLFFALSRARQYPTVTATSCRGSSARFDGDIGHIIIDASLVCRCVAMCGRGCRPQRIDLQQNKLTRGHIASASTASSNAPTPIPLARGHLILDGQPPMRAHRCGGGLCRQTRVVIVGVYMQAMITRLVGWKRKLVSIAISC